MTEKDKALFRETVADMVEKVKPGNIVNAPPEPVELHNRDEVFALSY